MCIDNTLLYVDIDYYEDHDGSECDLAWNTSSFRSRIIARMPSRGPMLKIENTKRQPSWFCRYGIKLIDTTVTRNPMAI